MAPKVEGGKITPVDPKNPEVQKAAKFAVEEHNKKSGECLVYEKTIAAMQQVVAGVMYYITLEAKDGEFPHTYEAKVWVQSWKDFMQLEEFKPLFVCN